MHRKKSECGAYHIIKRKELCHKCVREISETTACGVERE
ncbi:hypothetical protein [Escherichia phage GER2]|nr:hypothetical protein [Escherichia phage GER2]